MSHESAAHHREYLILRRQSKSLMRIYPRRKRCPDLDMGMRDTYQLCLPNRLRANCCRRRYIPERFERTPGASWV